MYHPNYCEENMWHLCQSAQFAEWDCRVLFITNPLRCCPLWNQKAAPAPDKPIFWDYHVVVLASQSGEKGTWQIWDSDSTLGSPIALQEYLTQTFGLGIFLEQVPQRFHPHFRMLSARTYVTTFSSDRSHMLSDAGEYVQPPPPWPPINERGPSNLSKFWELGPNFVGEVLDLMTLAELSYEHV